MGVPRKPSSKSKSTTTKSSTSSSSSTKSSSSSSASSSNSAIGSTRVAPSDGAVKTSVASSGTSSGSSASSGAATPDPTAPSTQPKPSSQMAIGETRVAPSDGAPKASTKTVTPTVATVATPTTATTPAVATPAAATPTATPAASTATSATASTPATTTASAIPTAAPGEAGSNMPVGYAPAETQFKDLIEQARTSGFSEASLLSGIEAYNKGYFRQGEFESWLNKAMNPEDAVTAAVNNTVGEQTTTDAPVATSDAVSAAEDALEAGMSEYEKTMANLSDTYKESQEALTASAEERYNAETKNLNAALALQQQLAAQQSALIASSSAIQKEELQNAYESNLAAVELQKSKVADAYASMKEEQALLNTQRKVREETAMGLIYGGFGSTAANKNLEDTIISGERALMSLTKEALDKDTEFQNQVVDLNKSYATDVKKIEQWKSEQNADIYATLSSYVQEITADKNMAAVEKDAAIREAVANYNTQVAEISVSVAETRMSLASEMLNRADTLKQQEFSNRLALAEETRAQDSYDYEQKRTVVNDARTDLDLVLSSYVDKDYSTLPADVLAQIKSLEQAAGLPAGAGQQIMEAAKADELKQGEITKEFTNSVTGEVTAIRYNFDTGKVETMQLGALETPDKADSVWTKVGEDADGNIITLNEVTGEFRTQGQYSGESGTPLDATSIPDGSYGGQCGRFVNQYAGLEMGNDYSTKIDKMDPSITKPEAGMVFVMPYSWTGHTGFIVSVSEDGKTATVKDSNWYSTSDPETVRTHTIPVSQMTGFLDVSGGSSGSSDSPDTTTEDTPVQSTEDEDIY